MRDFKHFGGAMALLVGLSACATLEPEPCTPEWVEFRTERILSGFASEHRSTLRRLRQLQDELEDPGPLFALKIANASADIGSMADAFAQTAVPEVRAAIAQCGAEPARAGELMTQLLENQGVGDDVLAWVATLGTLSVLMEEG